MSELYLKSENGNIMIEQAQIDKYNLKIGDITPNSGYHIVDKNGKENAKPKKDKKPNHTIDEMMSEGVIFTTSEIIDIAQGVDSDVDIQ